MQKFRSLNHGQRKAGDGLEKKPAVIRIPNKTKVSIIAQLPRLLTIQEAANVLGVSVRTVHTLKKLRQLTYIRVRGSLRFDPAHLDEYLQKRIVRAA